MVLSACSFFFTLFWAEHLQTEATGNNYHLKIIGMFFDQIPFSTNVSGPFSHISIFPSSLVGWLVPTVDLRLLSVQEAFVEDTTSSVCFHVMLASLQCRVGRATDELLFLISDFTMIHVISKQSFEEAAANMPKNNLAEYGWQSWEFGLLHVWDRSVEYLF